MKKEKKEQLIAGEANFNMPDVKSPKIKDNHDVKEFFKKEEVYADCVNTYFYDGKQVVDYHNVRFISEKLISLRKKDEALGMCDIPAYVKISGKEVITHFVLINQKIKDMPVREIYYVGLSYNLMKDKALPVFNYTLYIGDGTWDKATKLSDMFDQPMPEKLKSQFSDYDINIKDVKEGRSEYAKTQELKDFIDLINVLNCKRMPDRGRKYDKKAAICAASYSKWNDKVLKFIENQEG